MGSIWDDYETKAKRQKESDALSDAQKKEGLAIAREKRQNNGDLEEIKLRDLKEDLQPLFNQLRYSPKSMFMLPNIRMMHVERATKESRPVLMCNYGLRTERDKFGRQEKVRSAISYNLQEGTYNLTNQIWTHPHGGGAMTPPPPKKWIEDKYSSRRGGTFTHKELLDKIEKEVSRTCEFHTEAKPKRLAIAALSLVAVFGISQCGDADASQGNQDEYSNDHDTHLNITLDNE